MNHVSRLPMMLLWLMMTAPAAFAQELMPTPAQPMAAPQVETETELRSDAQTTPPALTPRNAVQAVPSRNAMPDTLPFGISLMFSEVDMRNLGQVVVALNRAQAPEEELARNTGPSEEDILTEILRQAQEEEQENVTLPEFYLSSIMYRSANDWTIWLEPFHLPPIPQESETENSSRRGSVALSKPAELPKGTLVADNGTIRRIVLSSKQREFKYAALAVESASEDAIVLSWRPENTMAALGRYKKREDRDALDKKILSRLNPQEIELNAESGVFTAQLRPNQTLSMDMMQIVEGRYRTKPEVESTTASNALGGGFGAPPMNNPGRASGMSRPPQSIERNISNQLLDNIRQIQRIVPQRNVNP